MRSLVLASALSLLAALAFAQSPSSAVSGSITDANDISSGLTGLSSEDKAQADQFCQQLPGIIADTSATIQTEQDTIDTITSLPKDQQIDLTQTRKNLNTAQDQYNQALGYTQDFKCNFTLPR